MMGGEEEEEEAEVPEVRVEYWDELEGPEMVLTDYGREVMQSGEGRVEYFEAEGLEGRQLARRILEYRWHLLMGVLIVLLLVITIKLGHTTLHHIFSTR